MLPMIDANYHSHTSRCGHAFGMDEEYVTEALKQGFKIIGFSDHVMLPGLSQLGMRGDFSLFDGYVSSVKSLKKKYAGAIDVYLSFECEWYYGEFASYYRDLLTKYGFDYLVLGQHCLRLNGRFVYYSEIRDEKRGVKLYTQDVVSAIESGLFSYIAHPDHFLIWYGKWDEAAEKASWAICRAAKEKGLPLEINMGPSRWKAKTSIDDLSIVCYPYPKFWEIAKQVGNEVIIGVDAHAPSDYASSDFTWVLDFAERLGFKPLKRIKFSPLS